MPRPPHGTEPYDVDAHIAEMVKRGLQINEEVTADLKAAIAAEPERYKAENYTDLGEVPPDLQRLIDYLAD